MGYIFQADVYCDECGEAIRRNLAEVAPEDSLDHHSYDSDDYPKDADVAREESDCPEHCADCKEFLHNPLTSAGYRYVQEKLAESGKVKRSDLSDTLREWSNWYGFTYWTAEDCADDGRHQTAGWYSDEAY